MYAFTGYELAYRFFMVYVNKIEEMYRKCFIITRFLLINLLV